MIRQSNHISRKKMMKNKYSFDPFVYPGDDARNFSAVTVSLPIMTVAIVFVSSLILAVASFIIHRVEGHPVFLVGSVVPFFIAAFFGLIFIGTSAKRRLSVFCPFLGFVILPCLFPYNMNPTFGFTYWERKDDGARELRIHLLAFAFVFVLSE